MKLCTFLPAQAAPSAQPRIGLVKETGIVDLSQAAGELPREMTALLAHEAEVFPRVREALGSSPHFALDQVRLLAPVPVPPKVLAIGLNYADHVAETGRTPPEHQMWFAKQRTCIVGPQAGIVKPPESDQIDYEGELVAVIGKRCRRVAHASALSVVAGYTIGNDVSVRDWQYRSQTMMMGKGWDSHGPTGPWLVTPDEVGDPHSLNIRTWVNGQLRQSSNTKNLIFKLTDMIAHLSTAFTLEPGDLIFTGTPAGVGMAMSPPGFLKIGDRVRIEIDKLGALENPVVASREAEDAA